MTNPHPEEKRTMNILGRFKAHGLAVEAMGGVRQANISIMFEDDPLFADLFKTCMGACPKCDQRIRVAKTPAPAVAEASPLEELLDEIGLTVKTGRVCSECAADLSAEAIICIQCGFNTETGKHLKTKREIVDRKKPFGHQ